MLKTRFLILTFFAFILVLSSNIYMVWGRECRTESDCTIAEDDDMGEYPKTPGVCTEEYYRCQHDPDISYCEDDPYDYMDFPDRCSGGILEEYYASYGSQEECLDNTYDCNAYDECNPGASCPGSSCVYHDYSCRGSGTFADPGYCGYDAKNPDDSSTYCNACKGSGYWNLGGDDCNPQAGGTQTTCCCGDDSGESVVTERSSTDAPGEFNDGITSCCDYRYECTYNDNCVAEGGTQANSAGIYAWCCDINQELCSFNYWYGGDAYQSACNAIAGSGHWGVGGSGDCTGNACKTACCGDDSGEFYAYRDVHFDANEAGFGDSTSDDTCCDADGDCVYNYNCYSGDAVFDLNGDGRKEVKCYGSAGTWINTDYHSSYCTSGGYAWNVGDGDATGDNYAGTWGGTTSGYCHERQQTEGGNFVASIHCCCGDDAGEYYVYFKTRGSAGADVQTCNDITDEYCVNGGRDTSDDACCNDDDDCVYNGVCYSEGTYRDLDGDGVTDGWCMTDNNYKGNWRDCDSDSGACDVSCGHDWAAGGETSQFGEYDTGSETECCGDDSGENHKTRACSSGCSSSSSDEACCNNANDCVYNGLCYSEGTYCAPWNSNARASCSGGSWSQIEDCSTKTSVDSDGGDVPSTAGTCTDYTGCSAGACTSTTYDDVCASSTQLTEYYASGASCPSKTYGCSDFEAAATGDTPDNPATTGTCTGGTGAGCSSGRFSTTSGSSGAEGCIDSGACPGGANCVFREYYAIDSGDSCPGLDTCTAKTYDPDTNLNTCSACVGSGKYGIGGISGCCGDDSSEYIRTRQCDGHACETDTSDDACCDLASDCVWQDACYNNGAGRPGLPDATCVNGVWEDITDPTTTINPNGGTSAGTSVGFTLSCQDTGGSDCSTTYYKIINQGESCGTTGFTPGTPPVSGSVTCPAGQNCDKKVCFYSTDGAGNTETTNQSNVFSLGPCKNKQCGESCVGVSGICNGADYCYTDGGCFLDCEIPPGTDERKCYDVGTEIQCSNFQAACGRSGAYKCGDSQVCGNSLAAGACGSNYGGSPTDVTDDWASYTPPSGYYGRGDTFHIILSSISSPSGLTILAECAVNKSDGSVIYFNNWGSGNVDFSYTIQSDDPEGIWTIDYCELWSDFYYNEGWPLKQNTTDYTFTVDMSEPTMVILSPSADSWHKDDFYINATVDDDSGINYVRYRWENSTDTGNWEPMSYYSPLDIYTASFGVNSVSEGIYTINVSSVDNAGIENSEVVNNVGVDKTRPALESYSVSGCDYEDTPGQICWVKTGTTTYHEIQHSDSLSTPYRQYLTFTENGCTPNAGCNPSYPTQSGREIKSYVYVDTMSYHEWMVNDSVIDIRDAICTQAGGCTGNTAKIKWEVLTGTDDVDHKVWTYLYDHAMNGQGYTATGWWVKSDNTPPVTQMTEPAPPGGGYEMSTKFNISWTGSDSHSGIDCYNVIYEYCDPTGSQCSGEKYVDFPGDDCTDLTRYEFDARDTGMENLNGYTFYFKSRAEDNAGNIEDDKNWETNITIFIPQLITFSVEDDVTKRNVMNYGGRVPNNRTVVIDVQAKEDFGDNLNITICHYNRTLGGNLPDPSNWYCDTCADTRSCNKSIRIIVSPAEERIEVDYYIYAENASDTSISEFLPPGGYFYYTVYYHPLCNFLVKDILKTTLGSSELIAIEVRNIQDGFDMVGLRFSIDFARFVETNSQFIEVPMNPSEEKIIYARLVSPANNFPLILVGNSTLDFSLSDRDEITVMIGFPPDFSGLSIFGILVLIVLATFIYLKFVRIEN